ncbi:hypothetical protein CC1G_11228 [Coprinopsis cinerea okayama7|uniref:FAD dependent oxidoreductase domain-containing protein n=1 Tax=Coprinopsis cinerea (strain Okayama-7 / 130 / ATCC MYA-4618 / FGSC 9003) TaxID=240176 RepID=A8N127_COPC7|nr:hypothetical protein CC1G_11228 [Coprinopsis cinerea okayama7\|eukprot:XP_001828576.1 hypothetical protein CC1G_11228 [Coprinopsis cinerea okayama7\
MDSVLENLRHSLRHLFARVLIQLLRLVYPPVDGIFKRVEASPGLPVTNPLPSYWMQPEAPIANRNADPNIQLPEYADIVIIGSGITGAAFARTILDQKSGHDLQGNPLKIVMLDARETCSGATGRNGGHITPILYQDYSNLKRKHGKEAAKKIIRFRLSHISELLRVAEEEGLLDDSQGRRVEAFDVFFDKRQFAEAKEMLNEYRKDLPEESAEYRVYESAEELRALQLSQSIAGCLSTPAGSIHPYRLVTGILSRLLASYPTSFDLFSHTPCIGISALDATDNCYTVTTPRGSIRVRHVIHATNGWVSHLLPGLRGRIVPSRGVMTAQLPRPGLGDPTPADTKDKTPTSSSASWTGRRSFVIYPRSTVTAYDYLTQQLPSTGPSTSYPQPRGEFMFGGGFADAITTDLGCTDDREYTSKTKEYLSTALRGVFSITPDGAKEGKEELLAAWSGVLGFSADERPWVGRIPANVTGRSPVQEEMRSHSLNCTGSDSQQPVSGLAAPGEWIAAGYSGEGMVHAWMSAKALAYMVLGLDAGSSPATCEAGTDSDIGEWFPEVFRITEERWRQAEFEDLMGSYLVP